MVRRRTLMVFCVWWKLNRDAGWGGRWEHLLG
jgi:hypothetical protein